MDLNTKMYQTFRGVDFSASPAVISDDHAADMLNMYVGEDGVMQKRPGWHVLKDFGAPINGIHYMQYPTGYMNMFVHAGTKLYVVDFRPAWRNFEHPEYGDVKLAGSGISITSSASVYISRWVAGLTSALPWQVKNMDVNFDGVVDQRDAHMILRYVTGFDLGLPAGNYGMLPTDYTEVKYGNWDAFDLANVKSLMFDHEDKLYIADGVNYYCIEPVYGTQNEIKRFKASVVEGYIPATAIDGYYKYDELNEEGTNTPGSQDNPGVWQVPQLYEKRNMLQAKQINTLISDGIHKAYYLYENNNIVDKVELLLWTRCKSVDGQDVPTHDEKKTTNNGTDLQPSDPMYFDAGTSQTTGIYYYYKYIWMQVYPPTQFSEFSSSATYTAGAKVKKTNGTTVTYYICMRDHSAGNWDKDEFMETYPWTARNADSTTPQQNEISYTTRIAFTNTPPVHRDGLANIRVTFTSKKHSSDWAVNKDRGYIRRCTIAAKYGYFNNNRFFLSGDTENKNMDWASAVDDPTYFPNDGWTLVGSKQTAIMGYLHYGGMLAIIKEDNERDATIYMRSAQLTDDNDVIFPVRQGQQGNGAISKYAICSLRDDPLFLAKEGVFAIEGTDASQERNVPNRSFYIDSKLQEEASNESVACAWGNYLVLCMPSLNKCYVADARSLDSRDGSFVYNWCVWDNIPATILRVIGDRLYFGTHDGKLCVFNTDWDGMDKYSDGATYNTTSHKYENGVKIRAFYATKRDHLGAVDYKKTMLNDGGVITLQPHDQSSAQILLKTESGELFIDDIQTDSDEPSVVIPIRKRMKNFDSIQTTIENDRVNEGLSILGVQYRYAITTNRR